MIWVFFIGTSLLGGIVLELGLQSANVSGLLHSSATDVPLEFGDGYAARHSGLRSDRVIGICRDHRISIAPADVASASTSGNSKSV